MQRLIECHGDVCWVIYVCEGFVGQWKELELVLLIVGGEAWCIERVVERPIDVGINLLSL